MELNKGSNPTLALEIVQAIGGDTLDLEFDWHDWISGWMEPNQWVTFADGNSYKISLVKQVGGGEGEGEYVERVVQVSSRSELLGFVKVNGFYSSYDGTDWNPPSEYTIVAPKEVVVIEYNEV